MTTMLGLATFRIRFTCNNQQIKRGNSDPQTGGTIYFTTAGFADLWVGGGDVLQDEFGLLEVFAGRHVEVS